MGKAKIHIVVPEDLLQEIDRLVGRRKRSLFFAKAAQEELKKLKLKAALEKAAGAWKDEDHPDITEKVTDGWVRGMREEAERRAERISRNGEVSA